MPISVTSDSTSISYSSLHRYAIPTCTLKTTLIHVYGMIASHKYVIHTKKKNASLWNGSFTKDMEANKPLTLTIRYVFYSALRTYLLPLFS